MVSINVSNDVDKAIKLLDVVRLKQLPFATSLAINNTAKKVKESQQKEMRDVFDRPNQFTLNSLFIKPATKQNLTALVGLKDTAFKGTPAAKYLASEISGGERRLKGHEVALRSAGILPAGMFAVPGEAAQMDSYGNMERRQIVQILSYFRANKDVGVTSNSTDKTRGRLKKDTNTRRGVVYFVGSPGDGSAPLGVWQRTYSGLGVALRPILIFVDGANYEPIYDFKFVAENTVSKEFANEFYSAWNEAERTAK